MLLRTVQILTLLMLMPGSAFSNDADAPASLNFTKNETGRHEYARIDRLPDTFGEGEFTLEFWIKPDNSYPVGPTPLPQDPYPQNPADVRPWAVDENQLTNWSETDNEPYSWMGWWWTGNLLLDGASRNYSDRDGSIALQFYGGGRLRLLFDDGTGPSAEKGYFYSVGAFPASSTPSLLDGKWHNVQAVRRWVGENAARLELWIDGKLIDASDLPSRVDMQEKYWRNWDNMPPGMKGWILGAEFMSATGMNVDYLWQQYEDYKGLLDELRFWDRAKSEKELKSQWQMAVDGKEKGLVGYFSFDGSYKPSKYLFQDEKDSKRLMGMHKFGAKNLSTENAPVK